MKQFVLIIFFLFAFMPSWAKKYHYQYSDNCSNAYSYYLSLQPEKGRSAIKKELIADPYNLMATYLSDYDDCLLLLFNGNKIDYEQLKHHQTERLNLMERGDDKSPWHRLCKAGVYMHWAFVNIRFNENFKAAANFRKSYLLLKENRKLFPSFEYNDIFLGIEEATVGALPDNYKWIASVFGMQGNIKTGVNRVKKFLASHNSNDPFYHEAVVYYAYLNYYLLSDKEKAWGVVSSADFETDNNLVNCFVKSNIALNYRKADVAIDVMRKAEKIDNYNHYPIFNYEYGYALLHKQDEETINRFNYFLKNYRGRIFVKDCWQKLAYAYYLSGNIKMANFCRERIINEGIATTDSDKQALRFAQRSEWPHKILLQSQLLIDGGYYNQAFNILSKADADNFSNAAHTLEYYFRLARVYDELGKKSAAVKYYNTVIDIGRNRQEQFAARAALQLGFLYEQEQKNALAINMYNVALSMKDHDFKNSIDQQAKAGLNRLSR